MVRGDTIAEWTQDFGPAEKFDRIQTLAIPSLGENTVAQLQGHADKAREDTYWANRADEMLASSTLIKDTIRQYEQRALLIANRSTFGPSGAHQRNGFPLRAVKEAIDGQ